MAASADSTTASRRAFIGGVAAIVPALAVPAAFTVRPEFDAQAYLDGMRALGSTFHIMIDGDRTSLCEMFPVDGWSDEQTERMLELMRGYRAAPDAKRKIKAVLIREGHVYRYPAA